MYMYIKHYSDIDSNNINSLSYFLLNFLVLNRFSKLLDLLLAVLCISVLSWYPISSYQW